MQNKKIAAIALIIAITLSAFGFVYAHWSDMVTINGVVEMGSLTLAFSDSEAPSCLEYYPNPTPPPDLVQGEVENKEVGDCWAEYSDYFQDVHSEKWGYRTLNIYIDNAYPQYYVHTTFILHNIGTVPLYVYGIELTGEKIDHTGAVIYALILDYWVDAVTGNLMGEIWEDVDGSGDITAGDILVINVQIVNDEFPVQIDPCTEDKMEIDLDFKQEAEECHTYTIHISVLAVQWNKLSEVWP
jgi:hypothetical protein